MKKYILLNLILLGLMSCKNDNKKELVNENEHIVTTEPCWSDSITDQIYRATSKGDTSAYLDVFSYCWRKHITDQILLGSMIMANKYKFRDAYYHVYLLLNGILRDRDVDSVNTPSKSLAMYYLLKAKELGYDDAKYEAQEIFKDKKIPSANSYLLKLTKE